MDSKRLIEEATSVIRVRKNGDYTIGDVGCALVTDRGNMYLGVCIDTISSMGFCAEHNAIGSMITGGESCIKKIVAVSKSRRRGEGTFVLTPCGRCREFIYQIDNGNIETEIILAPDKSVLLKELLPYNNTWTKIG